MSAPRPYETDPFHLQSSVHILYYDQFLFIFKRDPVVSSIWYLYCVLVRIFRPTHAVFHNHFFRALMAILKSFRLPHGTF